MSDVINRQCQECGGYEMDDGTSDICCCYEVVEDDVDQLRAELAAAKADLSRHKRAIDMARTTLEYVGNWGNDPTSVAIARNCEKGLEEITRILEGKE